MINVIVFIILVMSGFYAIKYGFKLLGYILSGIGTLMVTFAKIIGVLILIYILSLMFT